MISVLIRVRNEAANIDECLEPIVDSPEQAIDCFRRTDMDVLCLGPYVLTRLHGPL